MPPVPEVSTQSPPVIASTDSTTHEELWARRLALTGPQGLCVGAGAATKLDVAGSRKAHTVAGFLAEESPDVAPTDEELWLRRVALLSQSRGIESMPSFLPTSNHRRVEAHRHIVPRNSFSDVNTARTTRRLRSRDVGGAGDPEAKLSAKLRELKVWLSIAVELGASECLEALDRDVVKAMEAEVSGLPSVAELS